MPTLYKKTDRKPIPAGAEILTRKGIRHARWTDKRGRTRTEPLAEDVAAVLVERGYWVFDYQGADGRAKGNKGYTDKEATRSRSPNGWSGPPPGEAGADPDRGSPARAQTPYPEACDAWLDRALAMTTSMTNTSRTCVASWARWPRMWLDDPGEHPGGSGRGRAPRHQAERGPRQGRRAQGQAPQRPYREPVPGEYPDLPKWCVASGAISPRTR